MADGLTLVIDRRGVQVTLDSGSLRIREPDGHTRRAPLRLIESVAVHGNALVRSDVWRALAARHIPATLLPVRGHEGAAWLGAGLNPTLPHRRAQHGATAQTRLRIARHLVERKAANTRTLLQRLAEQPDKPCFAAPPPDAAPVAQRIRDIAGHFSDCDNGACLMGREGAISAAWLGWLATALRPHWKFHGRNRRPPRDPLNALLSLGYTLLGAEVQQAVTLCGLDPALGFLHQEYPGRAALVLDCIEPLRAGIDTLSINLLDSVLRPDHFRSTPGSGCRLTKAGRALYYPFWALYRNEWPVYDGRMADAETPRTLRSQCLREVKQVRRLLHETP